MAGTSWLPSWRRATTKRSRSLSARSRSSSAIPPRLQQLHATLDNAMRKLNDRIAAIELLSERKDRRSCATAHQTARRAAAPHRRAARLVGLRRPLDTCRDPQALSEVGRGRADRSHQHARLAQVVCQVHCSTRWKRRSFLSKMSPRSTPASLPRSRTARSTSAWPKSGAARQPVAADKERLKHNDHVHAARRRRSRKPTSAPAAPSLRACAAPAIRSSAKAPRSAPS